jgi:hypothetical protein
MTTTQAAPNGHRAFPPPCSPPHNETRSKDSTEDTSAAPPLASKPQAVPASGCHFPPSIYVPQAEPFNFRDPIPPEGWEAKWPDRCQFMYSDGRQCTMPRGRFHPSLCTYHSDREEQLFGDPQHSFLTRRMDFPELFSAASDLATAAGINRALAQVFRLLAQRRISRQEASTFAKLAHLLLLSASAASVEAVVAPGDRASEDRSLTAAHQAIADPLARHEGLPHTSSLAPRTVSPAPTANPAPGVNSRPSDVGATDSAHDDEQELPLTDSANDQQEIQRAVSARHIAHATPASSSQLTPNQHLHAANPQLPQNQHLRNFST